MYTINSVREKTFAISYGVSWMEGGGLMSFIKVNSLS